MADSFSKKENLKKKLQKKQEKSQKREERKSNNNKGKSLEEMLVYVDKFGNLTDLSPEQQEAAEARQKELKISRLESESIVHTGTISYFNDKGFGFIKEDKTNDNVFVHSADVNQTLEKGAKVSYRKTVTPKGLKATEVNIL